MASMGLKLTDGLQTYTNAILHIFFYNN